MKVPALAVPLMCQGTAERISSTWNFLLLSFGTNSTTTHSKATLSGFVYRTYFTVVNSIHKLRKKSHLKLCGISRKHYATSLTQKVRIEVSSSSHTSGCEIPSTTT